MKFLQTPLQFFGTGPDPARQEKSHPHHVYLHKAVNPPGQHEILVPDLGADKTWRLARSSSGLWERRGEIVYSENPGGGPRHVAVHGMFL